MAASLLVLSSPGSERSLRSDQPTALLDQKHPDYEARIDAWVDLALLYEGGAAIRRSADRLLKKRPREDGDIYAARIERFTYQNILGTALGWYGAAMFGEEPEFFFNGRGGENSGSEFYTKFLGDCDGGGTSFVDFFKQVFQTILTYQSGWVLTDLKALEGGEVEPASLEDQRSRGLLDPHLVSYSPINVINWELDSLGALVWAVVKVTKEERSFLRKPEIVDTWYYYDRIEYAVYEDRRAASELSIPTDGSGRLAKLVRNGEHSLSNVGRVPLRRIALSEGLWLANRAYLLLIDHLNQDNTLAWSLFMSNLAMPVIIGDVDTTNMVVSETGYYQFPAGTTYTWSEPEGKSFEHSARRLESLREEAFRCFYLQSQGRGMRATPAMQSGRSKMLEMVPAHEVLSSMGDDVRRGMQDVLVDVRDARRDDGVEPDVRGLQFEDDMTVEEVYAVSSLLSLRIPSKTMERYVYKKVAKAWMTDSNRKELQKVYKEIDGGPTMDERLQEELKQRIELVKAGMSQAMSKVPTGPRQPPGRGGAGPSASSK